MIKDNIGDSIGAWILEAERRLRWNYGFYSSHSILALEHETVADRLILLVVVNERAVT
jgi:hypothetical protein